MATVRTSDVAHSGPSNAQGVCVYAQTHEKLGGTLRLRWRFGKKKGNYEPLIDIQTFFAETQSCSPLVLEWTAISTSGPQ